MDLALFQSVLLTTFLLSESFLQERGHQLQKIFLVSCCHELLFEPLVSSPLEELYLDEVNRDVYEVYVLTTALPVSLL